MSEPYLREVDAGDVELLFRWANDKTTRQNAFNSQQITLEEHKRWFANKLTSDETIIYIYCIDDIPIGQIRIDIGDNCGMISYSIDTDFRSRGHGSKIIELLESKITMELPKVKTLVARVKKDNEASNRIFERLQFQKVEKEEYYEYEKELDT